MNFNPILSYPIPYCDWISGDCKQLLQNLIFLKKFKKRTRLLRSFNCFSSKGLMPRNDVKRENPRHCETKNDAAVEKFAFRSNLFDMCTLERLLHSFNCFSSKSPFSHPFLRQQGHKPRFVRLFPLFLNDAKRGYLLFQFTVHSLLVTVYSKILIMMYRKIQNLC